MKRNFLFTAALAVLIFFLFSENGFAQRRAVSGKEATGTYRLLFTGIYSGMYNEIQISALGGNKLNVAFNLIYPHTYGGTGKKDDITVNMGEAEGKADIFGDTAVYSTNEGGGMCKITIKFAKPGQIRVTQDQEGAGCGFGLNVSAEGTYKKISGKKPVFKKTNF